MEQATNICIVVINAAILSSEVVVIKENAIRKDHIHSLYTAATSFPILNLIVNPNLNNFNSIEIWFIYKVVYWY